MLDRNYLEEFNSPIRSIKGRAELFTNSALSAFGKYVTFNDVVPKEKVKVNVASKNLINPANIEYGYELTSAWGNIGESASWYVTGWIKVEPSTTYTISGISSLYRAEVDADFQRVQEGNFIKANTFTTTEKTYYIQFNSVIDGYDKPQLELGSTASEYTPFMPLEGGRGSLYYEGVYGNEIGDTYMGDSGIYTVSEWYWYDSGELTISFEDGYYLYVSTNGLEYDTTEDLLADLEIPIGTKLYYDTETDSLYRITEGLVGSTVTVGTQNLFDENKEYGYSGIALEENGVKIFTNSLYDREGVNREYVGFTIDDIWDLAYSYKVPITVSFEVKTPIDGRIMVYGLGGRILSNLDYNTRYVYTTANEWKKHRVTFDCSTFDENNSNGTYCQLSFYGEYGSGVVPFIKHLQIELGTTETAYTLYQKQEYTIDESLTIEATAYAPTTVIYPNNSGIFIEKAECKVCECRNTFTHDGKLKGIKIDRVGENGKFFGYGIAQKATINLVDTNREENIIKDDFFKAYFNLNDKEFESTFPAFYVAEVKRNENTNEITITAEDRLYKAAVDTFADLGISTESTLAQYAEAIASFYGLNIIFTGAEFNLDLAGGNFEGTESLRQVLNGIAEATQTIYYISGNALIFKRLNLGSAADLAIEKQHYFSLESKEPVMLGAVCHTTELGDNVISVSIGGETQYIRDNPFWELKENIGDIVEAAAQAVQGLTITPFTCSWRGNFLAEIGDKLLITAKDGSNIETYLLTDSINYNGGYSQKTEWSFEASNQTAANPATLGEKLSQTFARVDKVNKQIELVVTETDKNSDAISALTTNATSINATVSRVEKQQSANSETIAELSNKVEAQITADDVTLSIQSALQDGVDKVETATGFTFNEDGLTVSKSGSEISTQITEDGMNISKSGEDVLTANNEGVKAQDLHATTFLIIGRNSRFEDFGNRTACFWIGGND